MANVVSVIGLRRVQKLTGLSRADIEDLEALGHFPKRLSFYIATSGRALVLWRESAIVRWEESFLRPLEEEWARKHGTIVESGASHD